jgi:DNA-binding LacI/PurR family transcriptional regulator
VTRAADVSLMTVSRAMNDKPGLSQELRQKILRIAAEMDYPPLRRKSSSDASEAKQSVDLGVNCNCSDH